MDERASALNTPGGEPGATAGVEWATRERLPVVESVPGVRLRIVAGEQAMVSWVDLDPHSDLPLHAHVNEQIGLMISGTMTIEIGGEARQVRAGDAYVIPPNTPHRVETGLEPCLVIEAFAPPRADYLAIARRNAEVRG